MATILVPDGKAPGITFVQGMGHIDLRGIVHVPDSVALKLVYLYECEVLAWDGPPPSMEDESVLNRVETSDDENSDVHATKRATKEDYKKVVNRVMGTEQIPRYEK